MRDFRPVASATEADMKIRNTNALLGLFMLSILASGCQQDEFYQKEYLEGLGVPGNPITDVANNPTDPTNPTNPTDPTDPTNPTDPTDPTNPGVCGVGTPSEANDQFVQNSAQDAAVDILWVIDNSGSMGNEQDDLANNFNLFIQDFITRGIDFKMAITTTDGRSSYAGVMRGDTNQLTDEAAANNEAQFIQNFQNWIRVGTGGSGTEMGLYGSQRFFERYSSWARSNAYLAVVYVSDEQDQSNGTVQSYVDALRALKSNAGYIKPYSIVTTENPGSQESLGTRYVELTNGMNGVVADIHQPFYDTLRDFGGSILNLLDSFPLSSAPIDNQIRITLNGQELTSGWTYDAQNRVVRFDPTQIPDAGSIVIAYYRTCVGGN